MHPCIEIVFEDHHHVDAPQEPTEHDTLVDALAPAKRIARVGYLPPKFLNAARWSSPQYFEHALSCFQSHRPS